MNPALLVCIFAAITFVVLTQGRVAADAGRKRIETWASEEGLRIESAEPTSWAHAGRWDFWGSGRGTQFFRVAVVEASGTRRAGIVRVRSRWSFADGKLEVHWQ
jgi:hypothetical protein